MERKKLIICHKCDLVYQKKHLKSGEEARCPKCDALLYRSVEGLAYKLLIFSFSSFVFFFISLLYPIITINISGHQNPLNIIESIMILSNEGYLLVAIFTALVLVVFPATVIFLIFLFSLFAILKINKHISKLILKILTLVKKWSMFDIFFVSILVALVKIFDFATIEFDMAFYSMIIFIAFEIYLTKLVYVETLWELWDEV